MTIRKATSSVTTPTSKAFELANAIRLMETADQWRYASVVGGLTTVYSYTVSPDTIITPQGNKANIILETSDVGSVVANRIYFTQDANGVYIHGGRKNNKDYWVTEPAQGFYRRMPGSLTFGTSWNVSAKLSNGEQFNIDYIVTGTETIEVLAGAFRTFRITGNGTYGDGPATSVIYMAPQISQAVRSRETIPDGVGGFTTSLVELTAMNLSTR